MSDSERRKRTASFDDSQIVCRYYHTDRMKRTIINVFVLAVALLFWTQLQGTQTNTKKVFL